MNWPVASASGVRDATPPSRYCIRQALNTLKKMEANV